MPIMRACAAQGVQLLLPEPLVMLQRKRICLRFGREFAFESPAPHFSVATLHRAGLYLLEAHLPAVLL
jgi:hypothetical protein